MDETTGVEGIVVDLGRLHLSKQPEVVVVVARTLRITKDQEKLVKFLSQVFLLSPL
jgi:hypothetical protein